VRSLFRACALAMTIGLAACAARTVEPPLVTAPRYPAFIEPVVPADLANGEAAVHQNRAWRFLQSGDVRAAEREVTLALRVNPRFHPAETTGGWIELAQNDPRDAVTRFERALTLAPEHVAAWVGKGQALAETDRDSEAIAAYRTAISLDPALTDLPRRVEVLRARVGQREVIEARNAVKDGKPDEAIKAYGNAITTSPDSAFLYRELAAVERAQGQGDAALQHYRRAIALDPADSASMVDIGDMLVERNELDAAVRSYNEALAIAPDPAIERKRNAARDRVDLAGMPEQYRAIESATRLTRADLAALIAVRLPALVEGAAPADVDVLTDVRGHWAERYILTVLRAGIMESYPNHTFEPRAPVRRIEFADTVRRLLTRVAALNPSAPRSWESAQGRFPDVAPTHAAYPAVTAATASGVMTTAPDGTFQLLQDVTGADAAQALERIRALAPRRAASSPR
jgi:tetratricopeptide (TPR) repeat protein